MLQCYCHNQISQIFTKNYSNTSVIFHYVKNTMNIILPTQLLATAWPKKKKEEKKKKEKRCGNCLLGKGWNFKSWHYLCMLQFLMHRLYSMKKAYIKYDHLLKILCGFRKITLHIPVLVGTHTELWITPNMSQSQQASGTTSGYAWQDRVFLQLSY